MTRLILPAQDDPIVARMLLNLDLLRAPDDVVQMNIPKTAEPLPGRPIRSRPLRPHAPIYEDTPEASETPQDKHVDWQLLTQQALADKEQQDLQRWMIENGHSDYNTIMQGPLPITNSVRATLPPTQEDATGYLNTFGDMEIKVSENCVAKTQVAGRLDISDFSEKLPMRIDCKSPPKVKFSFDRE